MTAIGLELLAGLSRWSVRNQSIPYAGPASDGVGFSNRNLRRISALHHTRQPLRRLWRIRRASEKPVEPALNLGAVSGGQVKRGQPHFGGIGSPLMGGTFHSVP